MRDNPGAQYEISVDGVPRTHRDRQDIALQTARFLKSQNPNSAVKMKDLQTGEETSWRSKRANRNAMLKNASHRPWHGVYKDDIDYSVFCGEWCIGRIYENRSGPRIYENRSGAPVLL